MLCAKVVVVMGLNAIINQCAGLIVFPKGVNIDRVALLKALALVESSGGKHRNAIRAEPHLRPAVRRVHKEAYRKWGDKLICSYGPFQMLGTVALELGMEMPPERLENDEVAIYWTIQYLNKKVNHRRHRFIATLSSEEAQVKAIADLYNSGSAADDNRPLGYMDKLWKYYVKYKEG